MKNGIFKIWIGIGLAVTVCALGCAKDKKESKPGPEFGTPQLHKVHTYTFEKSYDCGGRYELSALFLSAYSKERNAPDLLYRGSCGAPHIAASTAGDDFALIADLGEVSIESVTAHKAFNYRNVVGYDNSFKQSLPAVVGHTYAVLLAKSYIRALWVVRIESIDSSGRMKITYAVKSYSIQGTRGESKGFEWEKVSQ